MEKIQNRKRKKMRKKKIRQPRPGDENYSVVVIFDVNV